MLTIFPNRIYIENDISKRSISVDVLTKTHLYIRWSKGNICYLYYKSEDEIIIRKNVWRPYDLSIYDFIISSIRSVHGKREAARYKFISDKNTIYSFSRNYIGTINYNISVNGGEINKQERIKAIAKELLFCKRKKALKNAVKIYKENRRRRILEEGQKYLIPALCNMIVEMVQN